jgi:hypothetical protein
MSMKKQPAPQFFSFLLNDGLARYALLLDRLSAEDYKALWQTFSPLT